MAAMRSDELFIVVLEDREERQSRERSSGSLLPRA